MSLLWLFLLDFWLPVAAASRASQLRRAHIPPMKAPAFARGPSRSIVHLNRGPPDESAARERQLPHSQPQNSSNPDPHWGKYNMWQALSADGRVNFCVLFFTIYISYLIYVLF